MSFSESYSLIRHWEVMDVFIFKDGTRKLARPIDHNIVVNNCSVLIACLMKNQPGQKGIGYWAVGPGLSSWDLVRPEPMVTDERLQIEAYRKTIAYEDIKFIDSAGKPSANPTNRIEIVVTFAENEANGDLREFALFGGNATSALNTGVMINHKIHPVINKTSALKLERTIRITF